jgi:hypothetical protein
MRYGSRAVIGDEHSGLRTAKSFAGAAWSVALADVSLSLDNVLGVVSPCFETSSPTSRPCCSLDFTPPKRPVNSCAPCWWQSYQDKRSSGLRQPERCSQILPVDGHATDT